MRVVLDTNVLVSSFLSAASACGRIFDILLLDRMQCVYDDRIMEEYLEVLSRERFAGKISPTDRDWLLEYLRYAGLHVSAQPLPGLDLRLVPDPDDLVFAEVAVAGAAELLITGNARHFAFLAGNPWGIRIASPAEALARFC